MNATSLAAYLCGNPAPMGPGHLIMPVNIQLSKISIASAISKTFRLCERLRIAGTNPIPDLQEQSQFPCN
jgi:hypothetical protein